MSLRCAWTITELARRVNFIFGYFQESAGRLLPTGYAGRWPSRSGGAVGGQGGMGVEQRKYSRVPVDGVVAGHVLEMGTNSGCWGG